MHNNGASITSDVIINSEPWNTWVHFITLRLQIYERPVQWVPGRRGRADNAASLTESITARLNALWHLYEAISSGILNIYSQCMHVK